MFKALIKTAHDKIITLFGHSPTAFDDKNELGIEIPKSKLARTASLISDVLHSFRLSKNMTLRDSIDTDGVQTDHSFITKDFGLVAAIEVLGTYSLYDGALFDDHIAILNEDWKGMLKSRGVMLDWCFCVGEADMVKKQLVDILEPSRQTMKRIGLGSLDVVMDETIETNLKYCRWEKNYLCVWVDPRIAETTTDKKKIVEDQVKQHKKVRLRGTEAMEIVPVSDIIESRLEAYVSQLLTTLQEIDIKARRETCEDMLTNIRLMMERQTAYGWECKMPGTSPIKQKTKNGKNDYSHLLPPDISSQLFPNPVGDIVDDARMVNYGGKIHGGVSVDLSSTKPMPFNELYKTMREIDIPYRIRITCTGDGLGATGLTYKNNLAFILSLSSNDNRQYRKAFNQLKEIVEPGIRQAVGLRISSETWVNLDIDDKEEVRARKKALSANVEQLARAIQAWGGMETSQIVGDALDRSVGTLPGLKRNMPSVETIIPFDRVTPMLPITRTASVWDAGSLLMRTPDGKPIAIQPASSKQKEWTIISIGKQGFGKSLADAERAISIISSPGNIEIPFYFFADIGFSSSGLIKFLESGLPEDKKYLVKHIQLTNQIEHCINPCDTQLTARYPSADHMSFLINLLQTLLKDPDGTIKDVVNRMIPEVLKQAYRDSSDHDGSPKIYGRGKDKMVDEGLDRLGIVTSGKDIRTPHWWAIVDALFKKREYHLASRAQRYAVPTIKELALIASTSGKLPQSYHREDPQTGQTHSETFSQKINAAIENYPILRQHTQFDIGESRVVALDLKPICGEPKRKEGVKKTAIAYMLARHIFMQKIAFREEDVNQKVGTSGRTLIPDFAIKYHTERARRLAKTTKSISYDEIHRAIGSDTTMAQWEQDVREARKYKIMFSFATQSVKDIPQTLFGLTSTKILMGLSDVDADYVCDELELNSLVREKLKRVKRPNQRGSEAIYIMDTEEGQGRYIANLILTRGPRTIWAFSTTMEDDNLRSALYKRVSTAKALDLLVEHFPEMTWEPYKEKLGRANLSTKEVDFNEEVANLMVAGKFNRDSYMEHISRLR